jgi:uncharacterized membrane protein YraQ (UPF0718 family)
VVQAVVRRESIARHLGDDKPKTLVLATGLGAASSSCSYAAIPGGDRVGQRVSDQLGAHVIGQRVANHG